MERPLWDRIQEIYYSTLPMAQSERSAFVASACDRDPVLLREVNSLLKADESSGGFLDSPVFEIGLKIITSNKPNGSDGPSPVDDLIGTTIDERYLVERELGQGGIGKVYLARDLRLHNKPIVIKVLLQASLQDAYVVKKFRQEVEALSRIDHPGVVSVLGAGELADGKPYIVMQYVSGMTLRSQIPSEGMDLERGALILKQIGAALDDVHEKGIFHRDLKPDNIMLQTLKNGTELVKVVDFGIAKVRDSVVAPSTVNNGPVGTLLYMSPEQLRGGERITAASDIYSLAVIAYEMVTGRRPFNPASGPQLLEMHRAGVRVKPTDLRANLPTEAQAIILRALSFERKARYQNATEFGDSLARALTNDHEAGGSQTPEHPPAEAAYATDLNGPATMQPDSKSSPTPLIANSDDPLVSSTSNDSWGFRFGKNRVTVLGSLLIILLGVGVPLGLKYFWRDKPSGTISTVSRSFTYWLTVQKTRYGKNYKDPFQSTGQEAFETGYKFRLNVSSSDPGYLYVFSEGPPLADGTSFTMVYPTPEMNNGSASLGANQPMRTNWNTFKGDPGAENFWIVCAASPVSELESAKAKAFKRPNGKLTDQEGMVVKQYLTTKEDEVKPRTTRDKEHEVATVRGAGEVLVKLLEFAHR